MALPELAIPHVDIGDARELISKAPKGVIVAFGAAQMTEAQALGIEDQRKLWDGEAADRFANCAVVGIGGSDRLFLQPKLLKSHLEGDSHWPGRVVRCFVGEYLRFSVFICSDLLNRPGGSSSLAWLHDKLDKKAQKLTFALWLQHNQKPRSDKFSKAIETIAKMDRTTIIVAASRTPNSTIRYENFAVSGAFARRGTFPRDFDKFTHRFHYVEKTGCNVSRAVLLRYDADAYRVRTFLADAIDVSDSVEKGEFFSESQPYMLDQGALKPSTEDLHIHDLAGPASAIVESNRPALKSALSAVLSKLVKLKTPAFLSFLDLAIVPRPDAEHLRHVAGARHDGGDLRCNCWRHRVCIDLLTQTQGIEPFAGILELLSILEDNGCDPRPGCAGLAKANVEMTLSGTMMKALVVYPFDYSAEALRLKLFGSRPEVSRTCLLLVADLVHERPLVSEIDAAIAPVTGGVDPGNSSSPTLCAIGSSDLRQRAENGDLEAYLRKVMSGL